ncbi:FtsX-like permease family protein [Streptomyces iconiensis]|uniref:ABC transporter permease n=1 Tax=Streptomyces iconiensis TaxID=1384038 RepID=A0ABT6ZZX5_9ACTN|nr:FtsX-like permease family protein [Streptomyces iconiensis]MDJ1134631.1 ABC transporter permease [Streptomyces iconiensis]
MTDPQRSGGTRVWARDLAMGARFALTGRQSVARTVLTGLGVGLGVVMLLLAASVPHMIDERQARTDARELGPGQDHQLKAPSDTSVLTGDANTDYHGMELYGRTLQAEGRHPATPPGMDRVPKPGEVVVSPRLQELLDSDEGREVARRLDARVVGTIAPEGLSGPADLAFYLGSDDLKAGHAAMRVDAFGNTRERQAMEPVVVLLGVVACAVLAMPIAVLIGAAARFGGERRDRRLAALRLIGADTAMARRIAAGESLVGALLGLAFGGAFFVLARELAAGIELFKLSVFPSDIVPSPGLGALVLLGVPAVAVAVTLFALRGVTIEPLGVVRESETRPRRLWWRLVAPAVGMLLLLPLADSVEEGGANEFQVASGVVLLLSGVALLLPWLVERLMARMRGGSLSWQLAVRRLQLSSGTATRAVSGITIAVAGAIALQMLFAGVQAESTRTVDNGLNSDEAQVQVTAYKSSVTAGETMTRSLRNTEGVRKTTGYVEAYPEVVGPDKPEDGMVSVVVGSCATLREMAKIGSCHEGQSFLARGPGKGKSDLVPPRGTGLKVKKPSGKGTATWKIPRSARDVTSTRQVWGDPYEGVLLTPSLMKTEQLDSVYVAWLDTDRQNPEALENVRTTVFRNDPGVSVMPMRQTEVSSEFTGVGRAVFAGATGVMLLIGASMIVSMMEQLRERRRQLAVLVAFGTRRTTLGASVLWQSAVPVVLGLALASVFGLGLGWTLLRVIGRPVSDWTVFLPMAGVGAGLIALVTLLSMPPLWRMMRPEGLRTE